MFGEFFWFVGFFNFFFKLSKNKKVTLPDKFKCVLLLVREHSWRKLEMTELIQAFDCE